MNLKEMRAKLESDTDKLLAKMGQARAASKSIQSQTQEALRMVEDRIEETNARIHSLREELKPYTDGKKTLDKDFAKKARTYENLIHQKMLLIQGYNTATESLDEAKLGAIGPRQNYPEPEGVSQ